MRIFLLSVFIAVFASAGFAQSRQETIEQFNNLKNQAKILEKKILSPDKKDIEAAARENVGVFRILPRETYDISLLSTRGGGAYYSFTKQSHNYIDIPQISFEKNYLQIGFYGTNYGFLKDLGEIQLAKINKEDQSIAFIAKYQPPLEESKARIEATRARGFEVENIVYISHLQAIVGHSYVLRAISYDEADVLVAFKVYRQDADSSLIIFWKLLEEFEKPLLARK